MSFSFSLSDKRPRLTSGGGAASIPKDSFHGTTHHQHLTTTIPVRSDSSDEADSTMGSGGTPMLSECGVTLTELPRQIGSSRPVLPRLNSNASTVNSVFNSTARTSTSSSMHNSRSYMHAGGGSFRLAVDRPSGSGRTTRSEREMAPVKPTTTRKVFDRRHGQAPHAVAVPTVVASTTTLTANDGEYAPWKDQQQGENILQSAGSLRSSAVLPVDARRTASDWPGALRPFIHGENDNNNGETAPIQHVKRYNCPQHSVVGRRAAERAQEEKRLKLVQQQHHDEALIANGGREQHDSKMKSSAALAGSLSRVRTLSRCGSFTGCDATNSGGGSGSFVKQAESSSNLTYPSYGDEPWHAGKAAVQMASSAVGSGRRGGDSRRGSVTLALQSSSSSSSDADEGAHHTVATPPREPFSAFPRSSPEKIAYCNTASAANNTSTTPERERKNFPAPPPSGSEVVVIAGTPLRKHKLSHHYSDEDEEDTCCHCCPCRKPENFFLLSARAPTSPPKNYERFVLDDGVPAQSNSADVTVEELELLTAVPPGTAPMSAHGNNLVAPLVGHSVNNGVAKGMYGNFPTSNGNGSIGKKLSMEGDSDDDEDGAVLSVSSFRRSSIRRL